MSNFVLRKSQTNNVALTLKERSQLLDPFYLVVFTSKFDTDGDTRLCSLQASFSNDRYDLLEIIETGEADPLNGEVYLTAGEWSYNVYESSTQTIVVGDTTGRIIQKGLCIVK